MPLVSVVTPTYNRASTLVRAIESVQAQTFQDYEHIVVDDGSTDETEEIVTSRDDDRLRYIQFMENRGANAARNRGIAESSGKFISFLDSDDALSESHLERVVDELSKKGPSIGGVYTSFDIIEDGERVDVRLATTTLKSPRQVVAAYEMGGFSCLTVRRSVFDTVGDLDEELPACQDQEFLIRFLSEYELHPIPDSLLEYHRHEGQISKSAKRRINSYDLVIAKHPDVFEEYGLCYINYAKGFQYAKMGDMRRANRYFRACVREKPTKPLHWYQFISSLLTKRGFELSNHFKRWSKVNVVAPVRKGISRF